jgi:hypothetical protein
MCRFPRAYRREKAQSDGVAWQEALGSTAARVRGTHKKATGTGPQSIRRVAGAPTERTQLRALVLKDEPLSAAYGSLSMAA